MASQYVSTTLDANIYQDLEFEIDIDTSEIAEEVIGYIDIADQVLDTLAQPDAIASIATGLMEIVSSRKELRQRNGLLRDEVTELKTRIESLTKELELAQEAATKPCSGSVSDES